MTTRPSSTSSSEAPRAGWALARDAAAFAALTIGLLAGAELAADRLVDTELERKYEAVLGPGPLPAGVVIGSSKTLFAVRPADLAPAGGWINLAVAGADPAYLAWWWRLLRARHPAPATAVLGVDWAHLSVFPPRGWASDSEFWPWPLLLAEATRPGADLGRLALNRFALIKERVALREIVRGVRPRGRADMALYDRGFVPIDDRLGNLSARPWRRIRVEPERVRALEDLVALIRADGTRLVVIQTPEYRPLSAHHPEANAVIARVAARAGAPFLDYNGDRASAINDTAAYFRDWQHLRAAGAAAFGPVLRRDLAAALARPAPP